MSRTKQTDNEVIALWLPCYFCDASPTDWCRTRTGRMADYLHGARTWPLSQAWSRGYQEGQDGILCTLAETRDEWEQRWLNRMVAEHRAKCAWRQHEPKENQ